MPSNESLKFARQAAVNKSDEIFILDLANAYDAGRKEAHKAAKDAITALTRFDPVDFVTGQSNVDKAYRILYKEVYGA